MAARRRHYRTDQAGPLCGTRPRGPVALRLVDDWHEVDCHVCQVYRFLRYLRQTRSRHQRSLFKESAMQLPSEVRDILVRFGLRYPLPACAGCSVEARENAVRQWTYMFVEQVCFERPKIEGWGTKRADPGRPISADTITQRSISPATGAEYLLSWDLVVSAGDENQRLNLNPESILTTGQVFIEVPPVDHLDEEPLPEPPPTDALEKILYRLDGLEAQVTRLQETLDMHERDQLARDRYLQQQLLAVSQALLALKDTTYEGETRAWFGTVRLTLKPKS